MRFSALLLTGLLFTACGSSEVPKTLAGDWVATGPGPLSAIRIDPAKKTYESHGAGTDHSAHGHGAGTISGGGSSLTFEGTWDGDAKMKVAATFTATDKGKTLELAFPKGKQSFKPAQ